ncbi:MAG: Fic family protein [Burkholderiaceae bacterium]|nr:Fic family protein [Burkholderiaceae bacterium]
MPRDYLTVNDVLAIHAVLVQRHGGADGLRDPGALESALFRPQTGYYADIIAEAAALMESLAINHPFVDGNKRVSFAATDVFFKNQWLPLKASTTEDPCRNDSNV